MEVDGVTDVISSRRQQLHVLGPEKQALAVSGREHLLRREMPRMPRMPRWRLGRIGGKLREKEAVVHRTQPGGESGCGLEMGHEVCAGLLQEGDDHVSLMGAMTVAVTAS